MDKKEKVVLIVAVNSGIGAHLRDFYLDLGWKVHGTVRSKSRAKAKKPANYFQHKLNFQKKAKFQRQIKKIAAKVGPWDLIIFCQGVVQPIGPLASRDLNQLGTSIFVNTLGPIHALGSLINSAKAKTDGPAVILFSGGGTNSANQNFGAYTISKIALIKATEVLAAENPSIKFTIIGPGWVDTKIHSKIISDPNCPVELAKEYSMRKASNSFVSMEKVTDAIEWVRTSEEEVSGRNISVAFDSYHSNEYVKRIKIDENFLKLRRDGNLHANGVQN